MTDSHAELVRRLHGVLVCVRELEAELQALVEIVDPEPGAVDPDPEPAATDREPGA